MNLEDELAFTIDVAREAGDVVLSYFQSDKMAPQQKGERDVVTAADLASERLIQGRLSDRFPADGIVGEEGAPVRADSNRQWYVDPLDGTLNYSRGMPIWSVSVALFENDVPLLGVIHDPIRRETFSAARGHGAWLNGAPIATGRINAISDAFVHMTVDFNEQSMLQGLQDIQLVAPRVLRTRNIGSAALALAYVACGRFDAMLHRFAKAWDYGAGVLLVQEAGGAVTDMDGSSYCSRTFALAAASSEPIHKEFLSLLRSSGDSRLE